MERQERPLRDRPRYIPNQSSSTNTKENKKTNTTKTNTNKTNTTKKKTITKKNKAKKTTTKKRKPKITDKQLQEAKKAIDDMLLTSGSMNNIDNNIKVKSKSTKPKQTSPSKKSKKNGGVFKKWLK